MVTTRQVEFLVLVEYGERFYTRKGIEVAFAERLAAVWEDDGPSTHGAVVSLPDLRTRFAGHLNDPSASWLRPLLDRLESGEPPDSVRDDALADYLMRTGREPVRHSWPVSVERLAGE